MTSNVQYLLYDEHTAVYTPTRQQNLRENHEHVLTSRKCLGIKSLP